MCDEHYEEDLANYLRFPPLTRRQFAAASVGAGLVVMLPRAADAQAVKESDVDVKTPDGVADCYFVHPASGATAGVIVWPDILGLRPAFRQMGKRLAESGYAVLVVNPFYRQKKAPVVPAGASFADQATRDIVMPLAKGLSATTNVTDAKAFVAFLDSQAAVDKNPSFGTGWLYLAKAHLDAGDLKAAEQEALRGLDAAPGPSIRPLGHYVLADVYSRQGREGEAAKQVAAGQRAERSVK